MPTRVEQGDAHSPSVTAVLLGRIKAMPLKTRNRWMAAAALLLLAAFATELLLSVRQQTQTFDESAHIYSGYVYWKLGDFGVNPEHPPLLKLEAALPLLPLGLPANPPPNIFFRYASEMGGIRFLYSHDADALLFRARMAAGLFALLMAALVFFAAHEMFGRAAALLALLVLALEPVVIANGALVTTDTAVSALLFGAIYLFYRYVKLPTVWRMIACGLVTGLALAAKHSALIVFPLLVILGAVDLGFHWAGEKNDEVQFISRKRFLRDAAKLAAALVCIAAISLAVLWASYGFRYAARPGNEQIVPPTAMYLQVLKHIANRPLKADVIGFFEQHHLLPEAYLYGLTDILIQLQLGRPAFVLGKLYPNGRWFYFPAAFVIKTSIPLMLLLALLVFAKRLWAPEFRREALFLAFPAAFYFALAMGSKLDIGIRHILPIYPFLAVLAGACGWALMSQSRRWAYAVILLLAFDMISSLRAAPNYLPYSNELWGGVPNTHKVLSDSNVGWSSGLKAVETYLSDHHITRCWFAYEGVANPAYYHIPCKPLPALFAGRAYPQLQGIVPQEIHGPVLIGSLALVGSDYGPGDMNPYQQFNNLRPDAILQGEILVFNGSYQVPAVSALSHLGMASLLFRSGHPHQAIAEARQAEILDPNSFSTHEMLTSLYVKTGQLALARAEYQTALHLYETFQYGPPPTNPAGIAANTGGGQ